MNELPVGKVNFDGFLSPGEFQDARLFAFHGQQQDVVQTDLR
jgi:hypothetical protein